MFFKLVIALSLLPISAFATSFDVGPRGYMSPYDGDTLRIKIRLAGVDTPEIKGDCENERQLAIRARQYTSDFIRASDTTVTVVGKGYYGRPLVNVCNRQRCLSDLLLEEGLAVHYVPKQPNPWCRQVLEVTGQEELL